MRTLTVLCDRVGDVGGAERYWETVLPAFASQGARVSLLAREIARRRQRASGARAIRWSTEDEPPSADAARAVAEELRRDRPDVVVTASVFDTAVLDAVRANAPRWIVRVHDHRAFCPTGDRVYPQFEMPCTAAMGGACRGATIVRGCVHGPRPSSFRRIAEREAVRDRLATADAVLVSSEHMRATCAANGIDAGAHRDHAAAAARRRVRGARRRSGRARARCCSRRGSPRAKGCARCWARSRTCRPRTGRTSIVAGDGDAEERDARAQAERDGSGVTWRGHLTASALRAAIDAADAVAVPSLWPEPFGLIGIEAQARGRPAVAYRVGGIGEWIDGAGIAVRRGDEDALASAIGAVLDERAWPELAATARERAERYRLGAHVERMFDIFRGAA